MITNRLRHEMPARFALAILLLAIAVATPLASVRAAPGGRGNEGVPALGHVFVIVGENTSRSQITPARAPYLSSALKPRAAWLTRYFALTDGSLGDYAAMTSGQFVTCEKNNDFPAREVPLVETSPAFGPDGTLIVTWDEGADRDPKHVLMAVIGSHVRPGVYGKRRYTHYSLLRTLEDGYAISRHLGHAARAHAFSGIWK